nr:reverse transcriptase domain-containing protein [Tanacetum cinerariifolium]
MAGSRGYGRVCPDMARLVMAGSDRVWPGLVWVGSGRLWSGLAGSWPVTARSDWAFSGSERVLLKDHLKFLDQKFPLYMMASIDQDVEKSSLADQDDRHSGAFPGDLSLGIPFPGDLSSGKRRWGRLVRDSFPDDNPWRNGGSHGPELNYSPMEKLVLSLVFAAKRLRRYFQAHPIAVITDQPIKQVMSRPDAAGRLQKWSIMLGEHNITYRPRTSIKGKILADFLNEIPSNASQSASVAETQEEPWTLFTDGSSCVDGSGAGLILTNPDGVEFTYALRFQFAASNNEAEYEALIAGLRIATQMGVKNIKANVDSKLVANQVLGTYIAKEDNMIKYLDIAKGLVSGFKTFSIS